MAAMAGSITAAIVGSMAPPAVRIEMVADVVCPYCHIGLVRLRKAIAMAHGANVEIQYTPFILRRHLPKEGVSKREVFRQQFGGNEAHGDRVVAQVKCTSHIMFPQCCRTHASWPTIAHTARRAAAHPLPMQQRPFNLDSTSALRTSAPVTPRTLTVCCCGRVPRLYSSLSLWRNPTMRR